MAVGEVPVIDSEGFVNDVKPSEMELRDKCRVWCRVKQSTNRNLIGAMVGIEFEYQCVQWLVCRPEFELVKLVPWFKKLVDFDVANAGKFGELALLIGHGCMALLFMGKRPACLQSLSRAAFFLALSKLGQKFESYLSVESNEFRIGLFKFRKFFVMEFFSKVGRSEQDKKRKKKSGLLLNDRKLHSALDHDFVFGDGEGAMVIYLRAQWRECFERFVGCDGLIDMRGVRAYCSQSVPKNRLSDDFESRHVDYLLGRVEPEIRGGRGWSDSSLCSSVSRSSSVSGASLVRALGSRECLETGNLSIWRGSCERSSSNSSVGECSEVLAGNSSACISSGAESSGVEWCGEEYVSDVFLCPMSKKKKGGKRLSGSGLAEIGSRLPSAGGSCVFLENVVGGNGLVVDGDVVGCSGAISKHGRETFIAPVVGGRNSRGGNSGSSSIVSRNSWSSSATVVVNGSEFGHEVEMTEALRRARNAIGSVHANICVAPLYRSIGDPVGFGDGWHPFLAYRDVDGDIVGSEGSDGVFIRGRLDGSRKIKPLAVFESGENVAMDVAVIDGGTCSSYPKFRSAIGGSFERKEEMLPDVSCRWYVNGARDKDLFDSASIWTVGDAVMNPLFNEDLVTDLFDPCVEVFPLSEVLFRERAEFNFSSMRDKSVLILAPMCIIGGVMACVDFFRGCNILFRDIENQCFMGRSLSCALKFLRRELKDLRGRVDVCVVILNSRDVLEMRMGNADRRDGIGYNCFFRGFGAVLELIKDLVGGLVVFGGMCPMPWPLNDCEGKEAENEKWLRKLNEFRILCKVDNSKKPIINSVEDLIRYNVDCRNIFRLFCVEPSRGFYFVNLSLFRKSELADWRNFKGNFDPSGVFLRAMSLRIYQVFLWGVHVQGRGKEVLPDERWLAIAKNRDMWIRCMFGYYFEACESSGDAVLVGAKRNDARTRSYEMSRELKCLNALIYPRNGSLFSRLGICDKDKELEVFRLQEQLGISKDLIVSCLSGCCIVDGDVRESGGGVVWCGVASSSVGGVNIEESSNEVVGPDVVCEDC